MYQYAYEPEHVPVANRLSPPVHDSAAPDVPCVNLDDAQSGSGVGDNSLLTKIRQRLLSAFQHSGPNMQSHHHLDV